MSTNWTSLGQKSVGAAEDCSRPGRAGIRSLYGLAQPYDFTRAIPFLIAILCLCLFVVTAAAAVHFGKLHWGTYRSIYFIYLCALAAVAAATSFAPRLAWLLIALAFIDFSLGMSTRIWARSIVETASVLPIDNSKPAFSYHPLLQVVPTPNYDGLNAAGVTADFWKVLPIKIHHNSYGLRGGERDKNRLKQQIVIAAIGGSTTYDIAVPDGETWPDRLEQQLGGKYAVLNHGVPGYSTAEHLIQTLFYLDSYDVTPQCALYYVGWNDIHNAHLPDLDPGYADWQFLNNVTSLRARRIPLVAGVSPLAAILVSYLRLWIDTVPTVERFERLPIPGSDSRLEKIYRRNVEAIAAINAQRGIKTIFVGQLLNPAKLQSDSSGPWWPLVRDVDLWPLQERFNGILKETADAVGAPVFIPPLDEFQNTDFIDKGHFSPEGAKKFAAMLAPVVRENCQANNQKEERVQ